MYIPKRYGQSRKQDCPFCGAFSTTVNSQGVPVCTKHKEELLDSLKCACGEYLDVMKGKFGVFCRCLNCGAMNLDKALSINEVKPKESREYTVRSDNWKKV